MQSRAWRARARACMRVSEGKPIGTGILTDGPGPETPAVKMAASMGLTADLGPADYAGAGSPRERGGRASAGVRRLTAHRCAHGCAHARAREYARRVVSFRFELISSRFMCRARDTHNMHRPRHVHLRARRLGEATCACIQAKADPLSGGLASRSGAANQLSAARPRGLLDETRATRSPPRAGIDFASALEAELRTCKPAETW